MRDLGDLPVADGHVRLAAEYRSDEPRNVRRGILVVRVGIHDDVGAELEAGVEAGHETTREPLVAGEAQHVVGPVRESHLPGPVLGPVVDHENEDFVDSLHLPGNGAQGRGQGYIVDSFMVVVLGGVGQLAGTVYAALGLGFANKFLESWQGAVLAKIAVLVFIIVFIQKRPQGLFAVKGRSVEA